VDHPNPRHQLPKLMVCLSHRKADTQELSGRLWPEADGQLLVMGKKFTTDFN
jgi:hypothetical protein